VPKASKNFRFLKSFNGMHLKAFCEGKIFGLFASSKQKIGAQNQCHWKFYMQNWKHWS